MARDHARILTAIWADDDFRDLLSPAQRLYMLLLTQRELSYVGCLDLRISRWAACAPDTTTEDTREALYLLEMARFVVVDYGTEEILVRSYFRVNEVWRQPNVAKLGLRQVGEIHSNRLRSALRSELLRLPKDEKTRDARTLAETLPVTPWETPPGTLPVTLKPTPPGTPTETHGRTLPETPTGSLRARTGARVTSNHEQVTNNRVDVVDLGGSVTKRNARDSDENPTLEEPSDARCAEHRHTLNPPPCGACKKAREAFEAHEAEQARKRDEAAAAERRLQAELRAEEARRCDLCDDDGYLASGRLCTHDPEQADRNHRGAEAAKAALANRQKAENS